MEENVLSLEKKKRKPQFITRTSNNLPVKGPGSNTGTLSSTFPSFQSASLESNAQKRNQQAAVFFSKPATVKEAEEKSSLNLTKPMLESISSEIFPKVLKERPEEAKDTEKKGYLKKNKLLVY